MKADETPDRIAPVSGGAPASGSVAGSASATASSRETGGVRATGTPRVGGSLAGRVAVVTGAARGIGRATALALAGEGAAVVVNYRERSEAAREVVGAIHAAGGRAVAVQADVADADAARALVETAIGQWGRADILVNNAGMPLYRLLIDTSVDEWDRIMAVHLRGAFNCARAVLPAMIRSGGGRIINVTSVWGQVGAANEVAYSTAKAGLIGFTRALAKEVGRAGITVNAVAPGVIETDMLAGLSPAERNDLAEATPVGRLGSPDDVAGVVTYLASAAGAFVTGQVIGADGGMTP